MRTYESFMKCNSSPLC